jgi:hypothetical protein
MRRFGVRAAALAAVLLTLGTSGARADYLNWSYSWALSDGPTFPKGFTNVSFALVPGGKTGAATIPVGDFSTSSTAPAPESFSAGYDLTLALTDNATQDAGTLTYHGIISGTVGPTGTSLSNTFSNPSQSLTLDGHVYHVSLDARTPIGGSSDPVSHLHASVSVTGGAPQPQDTGGGVQAPPPPAQQAPEPSGAVLACLGLSLVVAARRHRQRCSRRA